MDDTDEVADAELTESDAEIVVGTIEFMVDVVVIICVIVEYAAMAEMTAPEPLTTELRNWVKSCSSKVMGQVTSCIYSFVPQAQLLHLHLLHLLQ